MSSQKRAKDSSPRKLHPMARPELNDHAESFAWKPRMRSFSVVSSAGVVEHHSGVDLTVDALVRHLTRVGWPKCYDGSDLVIFDGDRARALVTFGPHGSPGSLPHAYRLWDEDTGRGPVPLWFMDDDEEDGDDD